MKLIVDIPDNWEKELNRSKITFADVVDIDTIRNGIPLDKIKAKIAKRTIEQGFDADEWSISYNELMKIIDKYDTR